MSQFIKFYFIHPNEHKLAAYRYYIETKQRMVNNSSHCPKKRIPTYDNTKTKTADKTKKLGLPQWH